VTPATAKAALRALPSTVTRDAEWIKLEDAVKAMDDMTETHDTSTETVERFCAALSETAMYEGMEEFVRALANEREQWKDAFFRAMQDTEHWQDEHTAAEAKLAVARDALAKIASLGRCDFAEVRATLATLDTDQPAPRDGVTVGEAAKMAKAVINAQTKYGGWGNLDGSQQEYCVNAALRALTEGGESHD